MDHQKSFSHGLLYSVPPQNLSSLHLRDEERTDEFEWAGFKSNLSGESIARYILSLLRKTACAWGIAKR